MGIRKKQRSSDEHYFSLSMPSFGRIRILFLITGIVVLAAFFFLLPSMLVRYSHIEVSRTSGFLLFSARIARHVLYPFAGISLLLVFLLGLNIWAFFIRERLVITDSDIMFSRSLFRIGHTHHLDPNFVVKVVYIPSTISITPSKSNQTFKARTFHEGKIAITCGDRIYRFGRALEDRQAAELADEIELHIRSLQQISESRIPLIPAK